MAFQAGYWGLFLASFLAATIVPMGSEGLLSLMLAHNYSPLLLLAVATLGNWLGGLTSFALGWWGKYHWIEKYLRIPHAQTERFKKFATGKESWIALFTWLPLVGDVLAVVLGLLRAPIVPVMVGMLAGKLIRYAIWGYLTLRAIALF